MFWIRFGACSKYCLTHHRGVRRNQEPVITVTLHLRLPVWMHRRSPSVLNQICECNNLFRVANASLALLPNLATTDAMLSSDPRASCAAAYTILTRPDVSFAVPFISLKELFIRSSLEVVCVNSSDMLRIFPRFGYPHMHQPRV